MEVNFQVPLKKVIILSRISADHLRTRAALTSHTVITTAQKVELKRSFSAHAPTVQII